MGTGAELLTVTVKLVVPCSIPSSAVTVTVKSPATLIFGSSVNVVPLIDVVTLAGSVAVIEILAVEQETWRMVCEKMPDHPIPEPDLQEQVEEITAAEAARILSQRGDEQDRTPSNQLNLDA